MESFIVGTSHDPQVANFPGESMVELVRPWCTNQCPRMWYVGGSRPDGAQVERFSSWGTAVPKGFLLLTTNKSLCRVLIKEAILV